MEGGAERRVRSAAPRPKGALQRRTTSRPQTPSLRTRVLLNTTNHVLKEKYSIKGYKTETGMNLFVKSFF